MTRAVVATAFGGPEVLSVVDVEAGEPRSGEVVVDVRAAGVNPIDWKVYSGAMGADPSALPMRLGYEAAGVVTTVGPDATGPTGPVAVGDEVIVYRAAGTYADRVLVPAVSVVPKPRSLDWPAAAGLMLAGVTAVHALTATSVGEGDTVLVHGGAGGVGLFTVQLARLRGARVVATASPRRHDALRALGAEPVAYGDGLEGRVRALCPDGVDAVVDAVGTDEAVDVSLAVTKDRGRIVTIAAFGRAGAVGIRAIGGGPGADPGTAVRDAARLELVDHVAAGRLIVPVAATYPLADAAAAHAAIREGHTAGKIALIP